MLRTPIFDIDSDLVPLLQVSVDLSPDLVSLCQNSLKYNNKSIK
jgi:hypothetical protein